MKTTHQIRLAPCLATALALALLPALASPAHAAISSLKIGASTVSASSNQSGSGWSWTAANQTLMLSSGAGITGGINFVTTGAEPMLVTIISNGAVSITGGIGTGTGADVGTGAAEIHVTANGALTLTGGLDGTLTAVAGTSSVTGGITGGLDVAHGATSSIAGGVGGDLSVAGGNVTVTSDGVGGHLAILVGTASITGGVAGRADITAGTVNITGGVGDFVFVIDGNVTIAGGVNESLGVLAGTVNVTGGIGYNLAVVAGNVTVTGSVDGGTLVYGGTVKVNGATITPSVPANVSIALNTLTPGTSAANPTDGWQFDGTSNILTLAGAGKNYTLTGAAGAGLGVYVSSEVTGTVTLQNASLNNTAAGDAPALEIESEGLRLAIAGTVTLASANEGILYTEFGFPLIIDAAAGATLNASGGGGFDGIYCPNSGLVIRGAGTLNFRGGDTSDSTAWTGIYTDYGVIVKDSVTVNATGGNYTGAIVLDSGDNDGIYCGVLSIAGTAKVNAKGGNSAGAGCRAGSGVIAFAGVHNASTAGHEYHSTLNHTGGTYNGATIGGGTGGNGNGGGGGGGGGAPTPLALAGLAALLAARALRKK
jgi:hypothetical protein